MIGIHFAEVEVCTITSEKSCLKYGMGMDTYMQLFLYFCKNSQE